MIKDTIANSMRYHALNPFFTQALDFMNRPDLAKLAPGRYEIGGEDCYAMISEPELTPVKDEMTYEAHRKYIDIQVPLACDEVMGVATLPAKVPAEFNVEKDYVLFPFRGDRVTVKVGEFIVLYPVDAHAPCHTEGAARKQKKLVIKVRVA